MCRAKADLAVHDKLYEIRREIADRLEGLRAESVGWNNAGIAVFLTGFVEVFKYLWVHQVAEVIKEAL